MYNSLSDYLLVAEPRTFEVGDYVRMQPNPDKLLLAGQWKWDDDKAGRLLKKVEEGENFILGIQGTHITIGGDNFHSQWLEHCD